MTSRHFFFVQGNASHFYRRLGDGLVAAGHAVSRVNICGGDRVFWGGWNATDYRGPATEFGEFLGLAYDRAGVTDIVLHNDCRETHRAAINAARARGLTVHVGEEGYLRPLWLTLERDGINGYSRLPADPAWYRETARGIAPYAEHSDLGYGMELRVRYDFKWQAANYLYLPRYPNYRTHRPYPIWAEYATWAGRLAARRRRAAEATRIVADLMGGARPFFVFALQLDTDSQIRVHSPFRRLMNSIEAVVTDFALNAPTEALLVIKNHPLDNGWINYRRRTRALARRLDVVDRVIFIDGGDLNQLMARAHGVINVNSTVGLTALQQGAPVIALGRAVYDIDGLTHQGRLAGFWTDPAPPNAGLLADFLAVLADGAMIPGGFYTEDAVALAVAAAVGHMTRADDPLDGFQPGHRTFNSRVTIADRLDEAA
ncbi:MAG: capsular biosynthesis protein [Alphaproteobacteria bacterium]